MKETATAVRFLVTEALHGLNCEKSFTRFCWISGKQPLEQYSIINYSTGNEDNATYDLVVCFRIILCPRKNWVFSGHTVLSGEGAQVKEVRVSVCEAHISNHVGLSADWVNGIGHCRGSSFWTSSSSCSPPL